MSLYKSKLLDSTKGIETAVEPRIKNEITFNPTPLNPKTPGKQSKSVERNSVNTTSILKMGQRDSINSSVLIEDGPSVQYKAI